MAPTTLERFANRLAALTEEKPVAREAQPAAQTPSAPAQATAPGPNAISVLAQDSSKPEPRRQCNGPHRSHRDHPPERRRIQRGVDRRILRPVEYVRGRRTELEHAPFRHRENLGCCHIEQ